MGKIVQKGKPDPASVSFSQIFSFDLAPRAGKTINRPLLGGEPMTENQKWFSRKAATFARPVLIFLSSFLSAAFLVLLVFLLILLPSAHAQQTASTKPEVVLQTGHTHEVIAVNFSPDGRWLASLDSASTASGNTTIKIWDVATGSTLRNLAGIGVETVNADKVFFSPDGKTLALIGSSFKSIGLLDLVTGSKRHVLDHESGMGSYQVVFSPDKKTLATTNGKPTIHLWDIATGKELRTLVGHTRGVRAVVFISDRKSLITSSWDKTIKFWNFNWVPPDFFGRLS